ncbi:alkyl sulfatase dimerization domain-containing protein [Microbulbifer sp. MLAF003]|uniref:alkyl/aryl-sulfatase n=1 Tax=unclassified Microbulbifer TaxID=2619833 RepID=UPI0024AE671D|nr:alkyl sulfatase dimerization domain-containing protein [Microbulbifer sp. MLAF003]WHI49627.1 alkyl sulfatase dimerization domain-containing protein [Microbulbifer sp. MLAF003]
MMLADQGISATFLARLAFIISLQFSVFTYADPPNPASAVTQKANQTVLKELPFDNRQDFENVKRGFIAPLPDNGVIKTEKGQPVWNLEAFQFARDKSAPDSANPSLWRQLQLISEGGLYEVTPRIYQVRSADLSNITFIEGETGVIVMDPLISEETAKAALKLYRQHRGNKPVVAVIYTHSHVDHYGGVRGVVNEEEVKSGKVKIFAPKDFLIEAVSENVFAGNHMARRASFMYGNLIPKDPKGTLGAGLGLETSTGTVTLIEPTDTITKTGETRTIDGLTFEFLMAPGSEAPAEMHFYIPELKAVTAAENATHTLHNLYTLRGAKVRNARDWSRYLNETIQRWGDKAEVLFAPHHWPTWGQENVVNHLKKQRDLYKYLNDQTLRLANHGYNMVQTAEMMELPPELSQYWANRGYYGSVNHDTRAVWNYYLGFFDGNPARLYPMPPTAAGKKYVQYMGGAANIIKQAKRDYDAGEYRWVAEVLDRLVSAEPNNRAARDLLADALEQMGYQQENGTWRNFFLSGAKELRDGIERLPVPLTASADTIRSMPTELIFDYLGIRLNGPRATGKKISININLPDIKERYSLVLENAVLNYGPPVNDPHSSVTIKREDLNDIILGTATIQEKMEDGSIKIVGDVGQLKTLLSLMDRFDFWWNLVTPEPMEKMSSGDF